MQLRNRDMYETQGLVIPGHSPKEAHDFLVKNSKMTRTLVLFEGARLAYVAQRQAIGLSPSPIPMMSKIKLSSLSVKWLLYGKENMEFFLEYLKICKEAVYGSSFTATRKITDEETQSDQHQVLLNILKRVFEYKNPAGGSSSKPGIPDNLPDRSFVPPPHVEDMIGTPRWTHCYAESHKRLVFSCEMSGLSFSEPQLHVMRQELLSQPIECLISSCSMPLFTRAHAEE